MSSSRTKMLLIGASLFALGTTASVHAQEVVSQGGVALDEIVVTGTRLTGTNFVSPTPITVIGAEAVQDLGATSLYNITKDIPTFRNSAGPDNSNSGVRAAGQAILDLRGLGSSRTLTLVDGVRPVPVNATGNFDSGLVPISLVERLDVVTGGASAAYGSDAVAGVVNIILKKRLDGVSGVVQYGQTQRGDGAEPMVSLAFGKSFAGDKGHFLIGGDLLKAYGVGTMYTRAWGQVEPGLLGLGANRPAGLPANILSNHVELISFAPGGLVTSGPLRGTTFAPGGFPTTFQYGPLVGTSTQIGTSNYGMTAFGTTALRQAFRRHTALARVEYEFTPDVTGFAQVNYGALWAGGDASRQPNPGQYIVLRDNPYLPAETLQAMIAANLNQITVNRVNLEYDPSGSANRLETYQVVAGLDGRLSDRWSWELRASGGRSIDVSGFVNIPNQANLYASAYVVRGPDGQPMCGPVATNPYFNAQNPLVRARLIATLDPGCVPSNIFGQGSISPEAVAYFLRAAELRSDIRRYDLSANLSGQLLELPAGPLSMAVGVEWRRDTVDAVACGLCEMNALTSTNSSSYDGSQNVKEAYGEVGVPVARDLPFIHALDLNGAVRRTDYSLSGAVTTWKVGGTWDVTDFLRLRATRSRDIRAPNINELYNAGSMGVTNITNPRTGGTGIVGSQTVGNPDLEPEIAKTSVIGAVFTPSALVPGFRASIDYFDIKVNGVIGTLTPQTILNGYFLQGITSYGQFIVQDNSPIGIQSVSSTVSNLSRMQARGLDIELVYNVPIEALDLPGQLQVRALGSHVMELSTTADGQTLDTAGFAAGLPKWVWNLNFNYSLDRFGMGLQVKYASHVGYNNQLIGPDDPDYSPTLANSVNRNVWPDLVYYSLNAQYDLVAADKRRLQIFGVINNLFDKDPPLVAGVLFTGGSPYDTIGRSFKLGARFQY